MSRSFHEEDRLEPSYDAALVRRLLAFLRPYRAGVALALVLLLASAALQLTGPTTTRLAIDRAIPAHDRGLLGLLAAAFALALVLEFAVEYAQTMLTARIGQRAMQDLRMALFGKLQRLPIAFYDRNPVGRLMTRVTSDVEALNELFTTGVVALLGDAMALTAIVVWMLVVDWRLALAAFLVLPGIALVAQRFRVRLGQAYREIRVRLARINAFLQEHLTGMRVVQLFGAERRTAAVHETVNREHLVAHLASIRVFAAFFPALEVLIAVALASLLLAGGHLVREGTLTVGVLAAFLQLARRFFQPMQDLAEKLNAVQAAVASSERIFRLLDEPEAAAPRGGARAHAAARGALAFEDVWFRYAEDQDWVLRGVSFAVQPGQTFALVGHTGAGKTTILSLLLRWYDVQRGRITVDGMDLRELPPADLRALVGFVPQDVFLFTGDVRANVALERGLPPGAADAALARVGASHLADRRLGERGAQVSVGERQLLAFARALAGNPAILVLDEATSSVDAEAEARVQAATEELMRGRTGLVVAHRLSTVQHADQILVLHQGRVAERGTHRELLTVGGLYQALYELQLGAQSPAVA